MYCKKLPGKPKLPKVSTHTVARFRTKLTHCLPTRAVEPELKFRAPVQASKVFGSGSNLEKFLAPDPERFAPLKTKNHCITVFVKLASPTNYFG